MPNFIEIDDCCPDASFNAAFDLLHKSQAEDPTGDERRLWSAHPNPFIRAHVEDTAARLRDALAAILDRFAAALSGDAPAPLAKAGPWPGTSGWLASSRAHLDGRSPSEFTLSDWLLLADVLLAEILPTARIADEAERLVARADLLGRLQALVPVHRPLSVAALGHLHHLVPTRFAKVSLRLLSPAGLAMLEVAKARSALAITRVTEAARATMKHSVLVHVQGALLVQSEAGARGLQTDLFDRFADLNRDWKRVAITEIGEVSNQGFVAAAGIGARVKRVEREDACAFCANLHGRVFTIVAADKPNKDGETEIWAGKTQLGRSASPAKRVDGRLVPREASELLWPVPGLQHPLCRGHWLNAAAAPPRGVDPAFADWLNGLIAEARQPERRPI